MVLSFSVNLHNGVPIIPFFDNKDDIELLLLKEYLDYIKDYKDVRKILKSTFKLHQYKKFKKLNKLFQFLFT